VSSLRVMVVDDEPFMRTTMKATLRAVGRFVVTEAADGATALAALPETRPDVVLCDINMEPMGGLQFVEHLRSLPDPGVRETPVVMITVHADVGTVTDAGHLHISGYLIKPVSPKQLGDRLRAIFRDRSFEE